MIGNVLAGMFADGAALGDFESIATVTVGAGGSSYVDFTSIPTTYKHLQIRCFTSTSGSDQGLYARFNSDSANNYTSHFLYGNGTSASSGSDLPRNDVYIASNLYSTYFAGVVCDILDYESTNKFKTIRSLSGNDRNGSGSMWLFSGSWRNSTNAISSIRIYTSGTIPQYSHFALYGIKG